MNDDTINRYFLSFIFSFGLLLVVSGCTTSNIATGQAALTCPEKMSGEYIMENDVIIKKENDSTLDWDWSKQNMVAACTDKFCNGNDKPSQSDFDRVCIYYCVTQGGPSCLPVEGTATGDSCTVNPFPDAKNSLLLHCDAKWKITCYCETNEDGAYNIAPPGDDSSVDHAGSIDDTGDRAIAEEEGEQARSSDDEEQQARDSVESPDALDIQRDNFPVE